MNCSNRVFAIHPPGISSLVHSSLQQVLVINNTFSRRLFMMNVYEKTFHECTNQGSSQSHATNSFCALTTTGCATVDANRSSLQLTKTPHFRNRLKIPPKARSTLAPLHTLLTIDILLKFPTRAAVAPPGLRSRLRSQCSAVSSENPEWRHSSTPPSSRPFLI